MFFEVLIGAHIVAGFVGLSAFWIPLFSKKGGRRHVRFGKLFAWCAYVVTLSAVVVSAGRIAQYLSQGIAMADQPERYGFAIFLGYLGVTTFASVRHAVRAIQTRRNPAAIRSPFHWTLGIASIAGSLAVIAVALGVWTPISVILLALSPVGFIVGAPIIAFLRNPTAEHMGWWYRHMGSMLGGGIAFHTAFAVFGARQLFNYSLDGRIAFLPWILPALVGGPAIGIWTAYYRKRFTRAGT